MADILAEGDNRLDNLPVATGKSRRGRPRKQRIEDVASAAAAVAAPALPLQAEQVKEAIKEAVKASFKPKPPAPEPDTVKGIEGLKKEIKRAATKREIRERLKETTGSDLGAGSVEVVEQALAVDQVEEIRREAAKEKPPHWWLLRMR